MNPQIKSLIHDERLYLAGILVSIAALSILITWGETIINYLTTR